MIKKIELKSISVSIANSQETHCFSANIYVNSKRVGTVRNAGHGGCDTVHITDKTITEKMLDDFCATVEDLYVSETKKSEYKKLGLDDVKFDFESLCCHLVNRYLAKNDLRRQLKRKVMFVREKAIYEVACLPTLDNIKQVKIRNGLNQVLNEVDIDEAVKIFMANT